MLDTVFVLTLVLFNMDLSPIEAHAVPMTYPTRAECMKDLSSRAAALDEVAKNQGIRIAYQCNPVDIPKP